MKRILALLAAALAALALAATASATWGTPVGTNVPADAPIAGGGYPVPAGSTLDFQPSLATTIV